MIPLRKFVLPCLFVAVAAATGCQTTADKAGPVTNVLIQSAAEAEQNADYAAAAQHYQKLHEKTPADPVILFALVRNLRYSGASALSVNLLREVPAALREEPGYDLELGKALLAAGDTPGALAALGKAVNVDPENWETHATLGIARDLMDDFAAAQGAYRRALALSPKNPTVLNNMAISLALSGDLNGAIETLKDAPQVARHNPQIRQNLALFYGIKGDVTKAKALGKIDLDDEAVAKNLEVYSQLRRR